MSVLFPAPFSPASTCTSPGCRSNETSRRTGTPENDLEIAVIASSGGSGSIRATAAFHAPNVQPPDLCNRQRFCSQRPVTLGRAESPASQVARCPVLLQSSSDLATTPAGEKGEWNRARATPRSDPEDRQDAC